MPKTRNQAGHRLPPVISVVDKHGSAPNKSEVALKRVQNVSLIRMYSQKRLKTGEMGSVLVVDICVGAFSNSSPPPLPMSVLSEMNGGDETIIQIWGAAKEKREPGRSAVTE